jgi:hypothetical protein
MSCNGRQCLPCKDVPEIADEHIDVYEVIDTLKKRAESKVWHMELYAFSMVDWSHSDRCERLNDFMQLVKLRRDAHYRYRAADFGRKLADLINRHIEANAGDTMHFIYTDLDDEIHRALHESTSNVNLTATLATHYLRCGNRKRFNRLQRFTCRGRCEATATASGALPIDKIFRSTYEHMLDLLSTISPPLSSSDSMTEYAKRVNAFLDNHSTLRPAIESICMARRAEAFFKSGVHQLRMQAQSDAADCCVATSSTCNLDEVD